MSDESNQDASSSAAAFELDPEFLAILACPEDKSALSMAPRDLVEKLNEKIRTTKVLNVGETKVAEEVDAGLIRADGKILYPIRDEIPILLVEEGISTEILSS